MAKMTREEAIELLKDRKVYVNGKSAEIQEKLFELGWKWCSNEKAVLWREDPFLYIKSDMTFSRGENMIVFAKNGFCEIPADEIIAIEVVPECPFKPFDKVMVRDENSQVWTITFFDKYKYGVDFPYYTLHGMFRQCIPYEGNEYLKDTTNKPEE